MSSFEVRGLDEYTKKMVKRLEREYPEKAKTFLNYHIGQCKAEATHRTSKDKGKLKKAWKDKVVIKNGKMSATLKNSAPHAHLEENGHITKNGGWYEGKHMLEKTMTHRQPQIDAAIDKLIDEVFNF